MSGAEFIFQHYRRVRRVLSPIQWSILLWLSLQGANWRTCEQILQALEGIGTGYLSTFSRLVQNMLDLGYIERRKNGGRGYGKWAYRITTGGTAFLKLPEDQTGGAS